MKSILGLFAIVLLAVATVKLTERVTPGQATAPSHIEFAVQPAPPPKPIEPFVATVSNEPRWRADLIPVDWPKFSVLPGKTPLASKPTALAINYALNVQQQWRDFQNKTRKAPPSIREAGLAIDYLLTIPRSDPRFPEAWETFIEARRVDRAVNEYNTEVRDRRKQGVNVGMTAQEILQSNWGKPQKINETLTGRGKHEQWVYGGGYLYLDDGVLTSIQTSR